MICADTRRNASGHWYSCSAASGAPCWPATRSAFLGSRSPSACRFWRWPTLSDRSRGHINPAVTLGALIARELDRRLAVGYWVAQVIGAIVAAAVLLLVAEGIAGGYDPVAAGFGTNGYDERSPLHYGLLSAIVAEIVLTAILVLTVLGSTDVAAPVGFAGVPIGVVLVLIHLVCIPIDGTSVNPARSIGPALFAGSPAIAQLWVFIIMPLIGGALGAVVYLAIHAPEAVISVQEAEAALTSEQEERQIS